MDKKQRPKGQKSQSGLEEAEDCKHRERAEFQRESDGHMLKPVRGKFVPVMQTGLRSVSVIRDLSELEGPPKRGVEIVFWPFWGLDGRWGWDLIFLSVSTSSPLSTRQAVTWGLWVFGSLCISQKPASQAVEWVLISPAWASGSPLFKFLFLTWWDLSLQSWIAGPSNRSGYSFLPWRRDGGLVGFPVIDVIIVQSCKHTGSHLLLPGDPTPPKNKDKSCLWRSGLNKVELVTCFVFLIWVVNLNIFVRYPFY